MFDRSLPRWLLPAVAALAGLAVLLFFLSDHPRQWLAFVMDRQLHPGLFILLMALLPLFGFPIIPFLVLVGVKFGPYWATVITALIFALHLIISFLLTHSFLRPKISALLAKINYRIPEIHERRLVPFSIIFMAVPGLPYSVKNFALATLNIPFRLFFPVGLGCNLLLALPFIGLGYSAIKDPVFALLFLLVVAGGYAASRWLKRKLTLEP
ncbi:MAG TPA: hypothetical protein VGA63_00580 [Geopsychrobacteraceae bacterium]|jgi:uncharacterized membrane protein YdjX (TVP38/TMEM64 family)